MEPDVAKSMWILVKILLLLISVGIGAFALLTFAKYLKKRLLRKRKPLK